MLRDSYQLAAFSNSRAATTYPPPQPPPPPPTIAVHQSCDPLTSSSSQIHLNPPTKFYKPRQVASESLQASLPNVPVPRPPCKSLKWSRVCGPVVFGFEGLGLGLRATIICRIQCPLPVVGLVALRRCGISV